MSSSVATRGNKRKNSVVSQDGTPVKAASSSQNTQKLVKARDARAGKATFKSAKNPHIGQRIGKFFEGHGICFGTVVRYFKKECIWNIKYDDGDSEDLDETELLEAIAVFEKESKLKGTGLVTKIDIIQGTDSSQSAAVVNVKTEVPASTANSMMSQTSTQTTYISKHPTESIALNEVQLENVRNIAVGGAAKAQCNQTLDSFENMNTMQPGVDPTKQEMSNSAMKAISNLWKGGEAISGDSQDVNIHVSVPSATTRNVQQTKPSDYINCHVAKNFGTMGIFSGVVTEFHEGDSDEDLWRITYDDGDSEDMNLVELTAAIEFYKVAGKQKYHTQKKRKVRRQRAVLNDGDCKVRNLLDRRFVKGEEQYLVEWKDRSDHTWTSMRELNCPRQLIEFHRTHRF